MSTQLRVSVAGGSGYAGGELVRLLLDHPEVELCQVTSERFSGRPLTRLHPNLRSRTKLSFVSLEALEDVDLLFLCLPHGASMTRLSEFEGKAERLIDLSADFRLNDPARYEQWYGKPHENPNALEKFVYGIPELRRDEMKGARAISSAGCNATATILGLYPLFKSGLADPERSVVEVKVGSSEGGNSSSEASHHPERAGCVRSFMPVGHRHTAEIVQELSVVEPVDVQFSATSIDMVRGVLATSHVTLKEALEERDIWKAYREVYAEEPFIRIVKDRQGIYRLPEPKILAGTNFCDVGFVRDPHSNRCVVVSAIDNLMKGAAGQAVQAMNLSCGFPETTGLTFTGLHPI